MKVTPVAIPVEYDLRVTTEELRLLKHVVSKAPLLMIDLQAEVPDGTALGIYQALKEVLPK